MSEGNFYLIVFYVTVNNCLFCVEWGSGWKGTNFIVEIEEAASASSANSDYINSREDIASTVTINATNVETQGNCSLNFKNKKKCFVSKIS